MGATARERGRLEVFLGCAPGVGKTYEMLAHAHDLIADGVDVVAAVVESHGRSATAERIHGIEVIARRRLEEQGVTIDEMDLEAVLARQPAVALVDEMAHSNATGSRHAKRWQDIETLRECGIDVVTTVNIQHLESLNDVVAQITGVVQRETVPDAAVRAADQIELVDIAPQALRQRLSAGKVYPRGRIDGALTNYFRQGNLTALRELALLWLADRVDENLADYRAAHAITDTWEARERVVVAVTGGPESVTLIRRASRIASRSSADLTIVHIVRGDGLAERSDAHLAEVREVALRLGARVQTVVGDDIPATLLEFARGVNATQLVLGTSRRPRWRRIFDEGVGATVVGESGRIDVHMVTHDQTHRRSRLDIRRTRFERPLSWLVAVVAPVVMTGVLELLDRWLGLASESAMYFITVLAVSMLGGVAPAAVSAVVSGLLLNFVFTDPRFSFTISQLDNLITILVMLLIAIAVAVLVDSATVTRTRAQRAAREAELLAVFSDAVLGGVSVTGLLDRVRETYDQRAVSLVRRTASGVTEMVDSVGVAAPQDTSESDTSFAARGDEFELLLAGSPPGAQDQRVLSAVATQAAAAVERAELAATAAEAHALSHTDELRRALLAAVSHDLRTPLAGAKAAVSSLRSTEVTFSADDTAELLATIEESVDHLSALVGNLLDSSRLAAGVVSPHAARTYLVEVVHRAAGSSGQQAGEIEFTFDYVWAWTDGGLLERVLANLIDNAIRHGGGAVEVVTRLDESVADERRTVIEVIDHGAGIPIERREQIFDEFGNAAHERSGSGRLTPEMGVGLGLSVARGFTSVVGGRLECSDTPGGGTTMIVSLPADGPEVVAR